jgi:hypothetical protein
LCGQGKICVNSGGSCFCAPPCQSGEFACPGGQACTSAEISTPGNGAVAVCVPQVNLCQGDCATKTVKDSSGRTLCSPVGTDDPGCLNTPPCKCFPKSGCEDPCFNVNCGSGEVCARFGTKAGQCVTNTCEETGCEGCNLLCHSAECVNNPCTKATCASDQVCRPTADLASHDCKPSCATVTCGTNETCHDGVCAQNCSAKCSSSQVCDATTHQCVANQCLSSSTSCRGNQCCNPLTGVCGTCPCEGVVCPKGQSCHAGECLSQKVAGTGGSSSIGDAGMAGGQNQAGNAFVGNSTLPDRRAFGRPTGGGGCDCRMQRSKSAPTAALAAIVGLLGAIARGRKRRRKIAERDSGGAS